MSTVKMQLDGQKFDVYDFINAYNQCDSAEELGEKLCVKLSAVRSRISFLKRKGYMSAKRADGSNLMKTYITCGRGRSPMPSPQEIARRMDQLEN